MCCRRCCCRIQSVYEIAQRSLADIHQALQRRRNAAEGFAEQHFPRRQLRNPHDFFRCHGAPFDHINRLGNLLKDGLEEVNRQVGSNLLLQGFPGAWTTTFANKDKIINYADSLDYPQGMYKAAEFGSLLKKKGVLTLYRYCTSTAHTEEDVNEALNRSEDALRELEKTFGM